MNEPIYSETTERIYRDLPSHYRVADIGNDYALKRWLAGVTEQQGKLETLFNRFDYIPPDDARGVSSVSELVDPATMDSAWLDWRAQFSGLQYPANTTATKKRQLLMGSNMDRGTLTTIRNAAKSCLVGDQYVGVYPRTTSNGDVGMATPWDITIVTKATESIHQYLPLRYTTSANPSSWHWHGGAAEIPALVVSKPESDGIYNNRALRVACDNTYRDLTGEMRDPTNIFEQIIVPASADITVSMLVEAQNPDMQVNLGVSYYDAVGTYLDFDYVVPEDSWTAPVGHMGKISGTITTPVDCSRIIMQASVGGTGLVEGAWIDYAEPGVVDGTTNDWLPQTSDPVQTVIDLNAKPAGVKLYHESFSADWASIMAAFPTWADWNAHTWAKIMEGGL